MKKQIYSCIKLAIPGILILVTACQKGAGETAPKQHATPVKIAKIRTQRSTAPVRISGRLEASKQMKLSFKIGGIIKEINVKDGDVVAKGQLLASLNPDEINARLTLARAAMEKAGRDFHRAENLYADSVVTLEQLQNASTAIDVAKAQLDIALFNHKHAVIRAPASGRILMRLVESFEMVSAGHPVFVFATETADWIIKAGVTDVDVIKLQLGDSASVRLDAYPDIIKPAILTEISGAPDPQNGAYTVSITLKAGKMQLRSGFVGQVDLYPAVDHLCKVIPIDALVDAHDKHASVFVINSDSTAHKIPVIIDHLEDDHVYIRDGLQGINHVITRGSSFLDDTTPVRITRRNRGER
ncbi:efflux RND transporter periplasmic adaptor subunit [bacterium]|nr:efflux RND transporter periplasmic adaptor subunit [bacterium]